MSKIVGDIYDSVKSIIVANIPAAYQELKFVHDVEQNDTRVLEKGYGLRFLSGDPVESLTKSYHIDQNFEMVLTNTNPRQANDSQAITVEKDLYDAADDVLNKLILTQAGQPGTVLLVSSPSFSEPELLQENQFVVLRVQFIIRYRRNVS